MVLKHGAIPITSLATISCLLLLLQLLQQVTPTRQTLPEKEEAPSTTENPIIDRHEEESSEIGPDHNVSTTISNSSRDAKEMEMVNLGSRREIQEEPSEIVPDHNVSTTISNSSRDVKEMEMVNLGSRREIQARAQGCRGVIYTSEFGPSSNDESTSISTRDARAREFMRRALQLQINLDRRNEEQARAQGYRGDFFTPSAFGSSTNDGFNILEKRKGKEIGETSGAGADEHYTQEYHVPASGNVRQPLKTNKGRWQKLVNKYVIDLFKCIKDPE